MPADLVAIATLMVLATLAPVTAWRRRLATRRFDAVYERNLLRRTGRGRPAGSAGWPPGRPVRWPPRPGPGR